MAKVLLYSGEINPFGVFLWPDIHKSLASISHRAELCWKSATSGIKNYI